MAVKKAIKGIDLLIENKSELKTKILSPEIFGETEDPIIKKLGNIFTSILQNDIDWLQAIKRQLLPEQHRTKIVCRHPKKDNDIDPDGRKYCMGCNANLS